MNDLYEEFIALSHTLQKKRTPAWISNKLQPFLNKIQGCLDIYCRDPSISEEAGEVSWCEDE